MQKTDTPIRVTYAGVVDTKYGTMYAFDIEMEGGDTGQYLSKSQDQQKFKVGVARDYIFEDGKYPKIRPFIPARPQASGHSYDDPKRQASIIRQSSLKVATDICLAMYNAGVIGHEQVTDAIKSKCVELEAFVKDVQL